MLRLLVLINLFFITSCSLMSLEKSVELKPAEIRFKQVEVSGEYLVKTRTGFGKNNSFIKKIEVVSMHNENNAFEKTITISKKREIMPKVEFLAPFEYESTYYLNKDTYTVRGKVDWRRREIVYNLNSPEYKWLGQKRYKFTDDIKALCFYSNLIECAKISGFISKAIEKRNGDMSFHVLWESYPYFQEQYINMPKEIVSKAVLTFDSFDKKGNYRFLLSVGGQSIVYTLNKNLNLVGHYWAAQGLTKEIIE
ncbi:hypothetical protein [Halobacteriovorax sp.]|uniref:hypothetical protein n=1 Tax=Halobacteriovorax sp. TaxID=2020862 RepID=UPI003AF1FFB9